MHLCPSIIEYKSVRKNINYISVYYGYFIHYNIYSLASIIFPIHWLARLHSKNSHFNPFHIFVSNATDMEFRLFLALGNEMIRLVQPFLLVNNIYFRLKRLCMKVYAEGAEPTVCFLKTAFSEN